MKGEKDEAGRELKGGGMGGKGKEPPWWSARGSLTRGNKVDKRPPGDSRGVHKARPNHPFLPNKQTN